MSNISSFSEIFISSLFKEETLFFFIWIFFHRCGPNIVRAFLFIASFLGVLNLISIKLFQLLIILSLDSTTIPKFKFSIIFSLNSFSKLISFNLVSNSEYKDAFSTDRDKEEEMLNISSQSSNVRYLLFLLKPNAIRPIRLSFVFNGRN